MTVSIEYEKEIPLITIENFEEPEFKNSKFILTSPRSLLACEKLDIKVKQKLKINDFVIN
jgi:hypothetical protein